MGELASLTRPQRERPLSSQAFSIFLLGSFCLLGFWVAEAVVPVAVLAGILVGAVGFAIGRTVTIDALGPLYADRSGAGQFVFVLVVVLLIQVFDPFVRLGAAVGVGETAVFNALLGVIVVMTLKTVSIAVQSWREGQPSAV